MDAAIPFGPSVHLDGSVDVNGNYELSGTSKFEIAGLNLQSTDFTFKKGEGLTFATTWDFRDIFNSNVSGAIKSNGYVDFNGDSRAGKIGGFTLDTVHAEVVLDPSADYYQATFSSSQDIGVAKVDFTGYSKGAGDPASMTWGAITLERKAQTGGILAKVLSGEATFTLNDAGLTFHGDLTIPNVATLCKVSGKVYADGSFELDALPGVRFSSIGIAESARIWYKVGGLDAAVQALLQVTKSLETTVRALYENAEQNVVKLFWAIANAKGGYSAGGYVAALNGLVGANVLSSNGTSVATFLLTDLARNLATTADTLYDWSLETPPAPVH